MAGIELIQPTGTDLVPGAFVMRWDFFRKGTESERVTRAASLASRKQSRIHLLTNAGIDYGFVLVGIQQPKSQKKHHLQVEYLFVSAKFRGVRFTELDNMLISEFLMSYVISNAWEISKFAPIDSIVLESASDKLFPLYESLGFAHIPGLANWMALPLP